MQHLLLPVPVSCEQVAGNAMGTLELLVNPYPILPLHFTLPARVHTPQLLRPMYADMLNLAALWPGMALFYNGAKCGASAPDHAHLQAVRAADIPLVAALQNGSYNYGEAVDGADGGSVYNVKGYVVPLFVIKSVKVAHSVELLGRLLAAMPVVEGECEPRMNVLAYSTADGELVTVVMPRAVHRPACYYAQGGEQRLVSPGALDMAGLVVTPRECDFEAITADEATAMLREVAMQQNVADDVFKKLFKFMSLEFL